MRTVWLMIATASVRLVLLLAVPAGISAQNSAPRPGCDPENAGIKVPDGFCALLVADGLGAVRHFAVRSNGDIVANVARGRQAVGGAVALRDTTGDGRADVRSPLGTPGGNGLALKDELLYLSTNDAVFRYRFPAGSLQVTGSPDTVVMGLPTGGHAAKSIALGNDGALFVNIGSRTNSCQVQDRQANSPGADPCGELESRAGIWRFDASRLRQTQEDGTRFATGLRNTNALTVDPQTGVLYGVPHGRDQLYQNWANKGYTVEDGAEKPSEVFVELLQGDDHGWPYCYHDRFLGRLVLAPEFGGDGREAGRCTGKKAPLVGFPGHWAPNGIAFYSGTQFPAAYRDGAFIAFHGSWNRDPLPQQGFNVVFQPMSGGRPAGEWAIFADGFQELQPRGRPVGVAIGPDGSLYISDDSGGRIWRIIHR